MLILVLIPIYYCGVTNEQNLSSFGILYLYFLFQSQFS